MRNNFLMHYLQNKLLILSVIFLLAGCNTIQSENKQLRSPVDIPVTGQKNFDRALWFARSGDIDEAIALFNGISKKFPTLAPPYKHLGILHLKQQDFTAAEQALSKSVDLYPYDAIAYNHLGIAKRNLGNFNQANKAYLKAIKLKPDYADAILNIGILHDMYLYKFETAIAYYEKYKKIASLDEKQNKLVDKWIADLMLRSKKKE